MQGTDKPRHTHLAQAGRSKIVGILVFVLFFLSGLSRGCWQHGKELIYIAGKDLRGNNVLVERAQGIYSFSSM